MNSGVIQLRGVEVHNLQKVDIDIPRRQLIVFCGVSGSGKTSLALDTLYAEGQRRYIESFSAYTRQFLERMDKPAADRIDGIPPSIAVTAKAPSSSSRATIGTATEASAYLRLLFAKIGKAHCHECGQRIERDTPESAAQKLTQLPDDTRYLLAFEPIRDDSESFEDLRRGLSEDGFVRAIQNEKMISLEQLVEDDSATHQGHSTSDHRSPFLIIVDRLTGQTPPERVRDSVETAYRFGRGKCLAYVFETPDANTNSHVSIESNLVSQQAVDDKRVAVHSFNLQLACDSCKNDFPRVEPRLFSFNSPLGACPVCEGFGNQISVDMDLVVPNKNKSLEEGAIAPWNSPSYKHELEELLALAPDYDLPTNIAFRELDERHLAIIQHGVPERDFGGLDGFFTWLEKRKYKMHLRVYLSRWKSGTTCTACHGNRLRQEALSVQIGKKNIAQIGSLPIHEAVEFFANLELTNYEASVSKSMLEQVVSRLKYLNAVGLGYLALDRQLKTLSRGEAQRVALTSALGSSLVNMLYVLDEPSIGLHPRDTGRLLSVIESLRDRGNSVVVVEHEEAFLQAADQLVEVGPAAGENGGQIVFQGTPDDMLESADSLTAEYLTGQRGIYAPQNRRKTNRGWLKVRGARGNNLKNITVELPLGVLCLVTGVSGAGKTTLIQRILYPALCKRKKKDADPAMDVDDVLGDGQIDDVILVDQNPIGKSPRSNPVTYIKAFDAIRNVFAETIEARTHNYSAGHFSFNVDGGRCTACKGDGFVQIDMQFMADIYMKCSQCQGTRYRKEILDVVYRGKNIADVLEMSVRQAFAFFRGQEKVQLKLKQLMDVGLDYLRLGQPANTLSAGEAQRLKLANYLSAAKRKRTLFLLDEPTTGLHFSDIVKLLDCFQALLDIGHSLIIVEHNLQLMKAADYIVDLGPGAAEAGGQVVATGTPEEIAQQSDSHTSGFLAEALAKDWVEE